MQVNCNMGTWLGDRLPRRKSHLAWSTCINCKGHIEDYLKPHLGDYDLDDPVCP
jgi:hypothetical protein